MQAKIERIGDAFAVLLPKEVVEACGFGSEATVTVENRTLVAAPLTSQGRPYPWRVECLFDGKPGQVAPDHIRGLSERRFLRLLGTLEEGTCLEILRQLREVLAERVEGPDLVRPVRRSGESAFGSLRLRILRPALVKVVAVVQSGVVPVDGERYWPDGATAARVFKDHLCAVVSMRLLFSLLATDALQEFILGFA